MHKDSIVGVGSGALGGLIPQGGLDDPTVHNTEEVVQDLDVELEAWLVKTVCNSRQNSSVNQLLSIPKGVSYFRSIHFIVEI